MKKVVNGVEVEMTPEEEVEFEASRTPTLAQVRAAKLAEVNATCDRLVKAIGATYPDSEIATWDQQKLEAERYAADNNADTPLIDALATARQISKAELATRILAKAALYAVATGTLIGTRQRLEDIITDEEATLEDIQGANWPED